MSDRTILPLRLAMLMQIHVDPNFLPETDSDNKNKDWLLDQDLIKIPSPANRGNSIYQTTEKGRAYVDHLCSQSLPVAQWIVPELEVV